MTAADADRQTDRRPDVDRAVFISDLHLSPAGFGQSPSSSGHEPVEAFLGFADHLCRTDRSGRRALVLLGDTLELLDPRFVHDPTAVPPVSMRIAAIADANRAVLDALGQVVTAGWRLHVVPGNHDMELAFPSVQAQFAKHLLGDTAIRDPLSFDPWIFFVRGLVYAEHGQQQHDLNAFRSVLVPSLSADPQRLDHPIGAYLDAAARGLGPADANGPTTLWSRLRSCSPVARGGLAYAGAVASDRAARVAQRAERDEALRRYADELDLNADGVISIDAAARRGVGSVLARAGRSGVAEVLERVRALRERRHLPARAYTPGYLHEAARVIDAILERHGDRVPYYVFGHSHVAERRPLDPSHRHGPLVFGTGTWTTEGPRGADLPSRRGRYPWVEVSRRGEDVTADLRAWDARGARVEVLT